MKDKATEAPRHRSTEAPDSLDASVPRWPGRPRKRFGQHFLEAAWVAKLIDALKTSPADTFLEIGPGRGALTEPLVPRVKRVISVEIDRDLAAELREGVFRASKDPRLRHKDPRLRDNEEPLRVIEGDFLDLDLDTALAGESLPMRVVGNLPYNISSPILFKLLVAQNGGRRFSDATLMLQREVADRLVARPGTKEYGALSIQVALHAEVERLLTLPPGAFRPPPKVTSAVVRLRFHAPAVDVGNAKVFERVVRGIFLQRRKTLTNALKPVAESLGRSAPELLHGAAIDGSRRPETLTLEEIARLSRAVL